MKNYNSNFYKYQDILLRILLVLSATIITIYFFPKSNRFKYEFKKGEPWQYETLYAPFEFAINKSSESLEKEIADLKAKTPKYFNKEENVLSDVKKTVSKSFQTQFSDSLPNKVLINQTRLIQNLIEDVYADNYIENQIEIDNSQIIVVQSGDNFRELKYDEVLKPKNLNKKLNESIRKFEINNQKWTINAILKEIRPNIFYNQSFTNEVLKDELSKILLTRGSVALNSRIIAQGEIVEGEKYQILETLNDTYNSQTWSDSQYIWKLLGYIILVALSYTMLLLFLFKYRSDIYNNTRKLLFLFFNVLSVIILTTFIVSINQLYTYVVPVCILPIILKAFFDSRVGLFAHVITVLILSFIVPFGQEYLFLQIIAGIVTILSSSEIYKRANLFISIGQIVLVYISAYLAFFALNQGGVVGWEWNKVGYFVLCGLAMLFVWPLIYIYEKLFGLVSDVSLLELSDTNSKLLKELSNKAPGTFHHSLNVANIAETAANSIGANAMLTRVGALYHDLGKIANPTYFTENQGSGVNPHDDLDPEESAAIIINHTLKGIELAKKNKIPDRIIDFIRTHHGNSTVYYFYKKALNNNPDIDIEDYRYPGPKPFSPETAILMIADSVEAASKSLKNPTSIAIDNLVDKIVTKQVEEEQFINADITFKEIETIKLVIKKKLANIYHLRIEYPE